MRIAKAGRTEAPSEERGPTFTGRVWADPVLPAQDGIMVVNVFFEPGARTHWHGAAADGFLLHLAVSVGGTEWRSAVTDEEYASAG